MITVTNINTYGWEGAIRGMRNPMNSWNKSDSIFYPGVILGENDLKLAKNLISAGHSDRKFLRMIHVSMDINAPLYYWKEADQYKIATTTNSTSTMHKLHSRDLTLDDFSHDHLTRENRALLGSIIFTINNNRRKYTEDKEAWYQMIQLLPSSYNQLRTWDGDYETLMSIYFQRKHHKLDEWRTFCEEIEKLPYMKEFLAAAKRD